MNNITVVKVIYNIVKGSNFVWSEYISIDRFQN